MALAASMLPEGIVDAWSVPPFYLRATCITMACGAVALYAVSALALPTLPKANSALALACEPIGVVIACCACLLWLRTAFASFVNKRTHAFVDTAYQALSDTSNKALARKSGHFSKKDLKPFDEDAHAKRLCKRGAACAVALAVGLALALGSPTPSGVTPPSAAIACTGACLIAIALYGVCATRIALRYQKDLDDIRADVDRKFDVARAEYAAHTAQIMASEATRAAEKAHRKALEAQTKPAFEEACVLAQDKFTLSEREYEVLKQLAAGRSRPRIASDMHVTLSTINTHVQSIYRKLGVHNNQQMLDILQSLQ